MPLIPTAELMSNAIGGIGAFNLITLEHAEAVVAGAERAGRPVILQISQNAVKFHRGRLGPLAAAARAVAGSGTVDVSLHLDHVDSVELLRQAPEHGFSSVMFDASRWAYQENLAATRRAVEFGHGHGLWVESELGAVGGKDGGPPLSPHAPQARTDPAEAAGFVAASGVDGLAVAVGSAHAMTSRDARLDHDLIGALRAAVPVPLVLHGSSGVPDDELRRAVGAGIVKVNIGTALNVSYTGSVRARLDERPDLVDPRKYLAPARDAMTDTVAHLLRVIA